MPTRVRLGDRKEELVEETVELRHKLMDLFDDSELRCNPGARIYLNCDPSKFEAWDNFLTLESIYSFHRASPQMQWVEETHPLKDRVVDENGHPKYVQMPMFPDGPHTGLTVAMRHDSEKWKVRLTLKDLTKVTPLGVVVSKNNLQQTLMEIEFPVEDLLSSKVTQELVPFIATLKDRTGSLVSLEEVKEIEAALERARAVADVAEQVVQLDLLGAAYYRLGWKEKSGECLAEVARLREREKVPLSLRPPSIEEQLARS